MKDINHIQNIYFIGIGGIGMSALAFYFKKAGKNVAGYDKTPSRITSSLESAGIDIHYTDLKTAIAYPYDNKEQTLVVYTPAVSDSFGELVHFRDNGFVIKKRAEVLGLITHSMQCLAVAGTHGKTTTSSILGHLLAATNAPVTAFVGGVTNNYNGNLIQKGNEVVVVEADEFDRSFLQLQPDLLCITSIDPDHLDIYDNEEDFTNTFKEFAALVPVKNRFVKNGLPIEGTTIGIEDTADFSAQNIRVQNGQYIFDIKHPNGLFKDLKTNLPGRHNLFNATTAIAMAIEYGTSVEKLPEALSTYTGVNRRFTYRIQTESLILIDDYAHHPTEIAAVRQSLNELYPEEEVLAIFQPHLFSRTKDFMNDFAKELSLFSEVALLDIYPARELPIAGITSEALLERITLSRKQITTKENLTRLVKEANKKVVVMMGAGDIGVEILKVTENLTYEG